jgi:hypothetical protein
LAAARGAASANGTNDAKDTTATFAAPGTYTLAVTIEDPDGLAVTSSVNVTVLPAAVTAVVVTPGSATVAAGATQPFSAVALDQFGNAYQPAFTWSIDAGGVGTVSADGLYTAPDTGTGTATVRATLGDVSGTADVTVTDPVPFQWEGPPTSPKRQRGDRSIPALVLRAGVEDPTCRGDVQATARALRGV